MGLGVTWIRFKLFFSFSFIFLRTICAINCSEALAQLKSIHALGHWVAQNIAKIKILCDAKHWRESIYKIERTHTHSHLDVGYFGKERHSREKRCAVNWQVENENMSVYICNYIVEKSLLALLWLGSISKKHMGQSETPIEIVAWNML